MEEPKLSLIKLIKAQLGLSGTPGNNFTLDASADNGTMKLARGNAGATTQDILTVGADGKVTFPQNAQSWQNVAASRVIGTTYSNNTGQTIDISVSLINTLAGTLLSIYVNNVQTINSNSQSAINNRMAVYGRVPAGATYKVVTSQGVNSSISWWELNS